MSEIHLKLLERLFRSGFDGLVKVSVFVFFTAAALFLIFERYPELHAGFPAWVRPTVFLCWFLSGAVLVYAGVALLYVHAKRLLDRRAASHSINNLTEEALSWLAKIHDANVLLAPSQDSAILELLDARLIVPQGKPTLKLSGRGGPTPVANYMLTPAARACLDAKDNP